MLGFVPQPSLRPWGSGQTYSRTFDADGRLSDYPLGLDTRFVSYDPASRITGYSHTTAANDRSFDYDLVDRLILDSDSTTSRSFTYDANGNRTGFSQNGANAAYTLDPGSNRLLGLGGSMTKTYSVDAAGHLTGNGTTTFDWNAAGRLARTMTGALSNTYRYTGLGERVIKAGAYIPQQPHRYVYDLQGHLIGEYDKNNALRQETVWLGDLPVAVVKKDAGLFQFYPVQADHLNTPRVILNSANTPVWRWDATDAFGTVQPNGDPDGDGLLFEYSLRFPGQFYDKETGLHYNYFRDYDPVTGRYIDSDPIGLLGGLNTYAYVGGNPLNAIDPLGLYEFSLNCKQKQKEQIDKACPIAQEKADIGGVGNAFSQVLDNTTFDCTFPPKLPKTKNDCGINYGNTIYLIKAFNNKQCGPLENTIGHEASHSPPFNYREDNAFIFEYGLFGKTPADPAVFRKKYPQLPGNAYENYENFYKNIYLW